jgi:tetratricopeptide (TPR) repeat protein
MCYLRCAAIVSLTLQLTLQLSPCALGADSYTDGLARYNAGDYTSAKNYFLKVAGDKPMYYQSHYLLANTFVKLKDLESARKWYDICLKCNPDKATADNCRKAIAYLDKTVASGGAEPTVKKESKTSAIAQAPSEQKKGYLGLRLEGALVMDVMRGSSAEQGGIKTGDKITSYDGISTAELDGEEVTKRLAGIAGTPVQLVVERQGKTYSCPLTRWEMVARGGRWEFQKTAPIAETTAKDASASAGNSQTVARNQTNSASQRWEARDEFVNGLNDEPKLSDPTYQKVERGLRTIPKDIRDALKEAGYTVMLTPTMLAAVPQWSGATPRGWSEDSNYDNVGGLFQSRQKWILLAEKVQSMKNGNEYQENTRLVSTVRHELGHAYDNYQGSYSSGDDFSDAYGNDVDRIPARDQTRFAYFLQPGNAGRSELFAEVFAAVYTPDDEQNQGQIALMKAFPKVATLMKKINPNRPKSGGTSTK